MLHSRSEYQHFVADMTEKPGREILCRSLFIRLWQKSYGIQGELSLSTKSNRRPKLTYMHDPS